MRGASMRTELATDGGESRTRKYPWARQARAAKGKPGEGVGGGQPGQTADQVYSFEEIARSCPSGPKPEI